MEKNCWPEGHFTSVLPNAAHTFTTKCKCGFATDAASNPAAWAASKAHRVAVTGA